MIRHVCITAAAPSAAPPSHQKPSSGGAPSPRSLPPPRRPTPSPTRWASSSRAPAASRRQNQIPASSRPPAPSTTSDQRRRLLALGRRSRAQGLPVDVSFDALQTPGLVSRDYQTGDGAYVLVAGQGALKKVVSTKSSPPTASTVPTGRRPTCASRSENRGDGDEVFEYTFVALTPAMREVARRVRARRSRSVYDVFILVAGSTAARWKNAEPPLQAADSFRPRRRLRRR